MGLTYPFDNAVLNKDLPTPGPCISALLLPHDVPRLEIPIQVLSDVSLVVDIFRSPSAYNSPKDQPGNEHHLPV